MTRPTPSTWGCRCRPRRRHRSRRARSPEEAGEQAPHERSTITDVAFTVAVASTPGASPSSSTASRVTAAVTRKARRRSPPAPSLRRPRPSARPPEAVARGERFARAVAARTRAEPAHLGDRHPPPIRSSRTVFSLPARSQRRSVSIDTSSARAASPSESEFVLRHLPKHCIGIGVRPLESPPLWGSDPFYAAATWADAGAPSRSSRPRARASSPSTSISSAA